MDNLINCSRCGSDACYVEEVNQDVKTYFCYGCGFQTNSILKKGELFFDIPPTGSENSHLTLATRSLEYIGLSLDDLQNEISLLREENIDLKNQILLASQIELGTQI